MDHTKTKEKSPQTNGIFKNMVAPYGLPLFQNASNFRYLAAICAKVLRARLVLIRREHFRGGRDSALALNSLRLDSGVFTSVLPDGGMSSYPVAPFSEPWQRNA